MNRATNASLAAVQGIIAVTRSGFTCVKSLMLPLLMGFAMAGCAASARDSDAIQAPLAGDPNLRNIAVSDGAPIVGERDPVAARDMYVRTTLAISESPDDACLLTATRTVVHVLKHRFDVSAGTEEPRIAAKPRESRLRSLLRSLPEIVAQQIRHWILKGLS